MSLRTHFFCIFLFFLGGAPTSLLIAQNQVSFRQLSIREGLSQNSAISVVQDSTGYLWIATQDGLNRYDGRKFEVFTQYFEDITNPTYSQLGKVYVDRNGGIWSLPVSHVPQKLDTLTNHFVPYTKLQNISVIYQARDHRFWFGSYGHGLFSMDVQTGEILQVLNVEQAGTVYAISEDGDRNLWLACKNQLISLDPEDPTALQSHHPGNGPRDTINYSNILFDRNGNQWVGTYGHGIWYREKGSTAFKHPDIFIADANSRLDKVYALSMLLDSRNQLWIGTYGEGVFKIDLNLNQLDQYLPNKHDPTAIHYPDILSIYEDYTGTIWFGTDGAGVSYYDPYLEKFNSFTNIQTPEHVSIDVVRALVKDQRNRVWIGTSGKGLTRYDPMDDSWKTYVKNGGPNGLSSNRIMSLLSATNGDLWIGTQEGGLDILDKSSKIIRYTEDTHISFPAKTIWCMLEDEKGGKWLGTRDKGLLKFDPKRGVLETYDSSLSSNPLPSNNIRAMTFGRANTLWVATQDHGIAMLDLLDHTITRYTTDNGLASNHIKSLYYDPNGILWIGTYGAGICALDLSTARFHNYDETDGLANNVIYGILPDEEHNLWLSSNKGITKFRVPAQWTDAPIITNYNNYDGLATEFNTGAYYKASNGNLYFGGIDGFYWFHPSQVGANPILPKTVITGLSLFNRSMDLLPKPSFRADQNTIAFTFSSLQFSLPQKNGYQYQLEGHDGTWISSGSSNTVRYTNLSPGHYVFKVRSSNYDGLWNERPATYSFTIRRAWYNNALAWWIYSVLALGGLYVAYAYFKWRWQMQWKLKKQEEESQRLKELDAYKTKLYTNVSHEFRTPLTLISAPIKKRLEDPDLSPPLRGELRAIDQNANQLLGLVDELLDLSILESGTAKLRVELRDLDVMLRASVACFVPLAENKGLALDYRIAEIKDAWFDVDVVLKIVNNLLGNAIKYSPEKGKIQLKAHRTASRSLHLEISNSLPPHSFPDLDTIFERFYQADQNTDGFGIGLSLVRELTKLAHGNISVSRSETHTICFVVELPLHKTAFAATELKEPSPLVPLTEIAKLPLEPKAPVEKPLLLIIEDQRELQHFISGLFKEEFTIITADDGKTGIERALKTIPDLIISDIMMPLASGIEVCNTLKEDERSSHIPIILLTAKSRLEDELQGIGTGADDYMIKPFHPEKLRARAKNLVTERIRLRKNFEQQAILMPRELSLAPLDQQFLERTQKVMDQHLLEPDFNANQFSREMGMSRMQLHRKLKALTGLSTSAFIRSQRLKSAIPMLQNTQATIAEVCYSTGFNSPSYFIKCFKETYGRTPMEYMRKKS